MAGISFGGISSGLDTESIVNQLMSLEANPQRLLQQKLTRQDTATSALQAFNTKIASLATSAAALAKPDAWTTPAVTSTAKSVTASAQAGAGTGSLTFDVTALAQAASYTSAPIADVPEPHSPRTFTISGTAPEFKSLTVTSASSNVRDMARAINAADGDVVAAAVPTGTGEYRLVVSAKLTGAGTLSFSGDAPPFTSLREGADAVLSLGTGVEVRSRSNTFIGLLNGVDVTVSAKETGVTVTSVPDSSTAAKRAAEVIGSLGVVLSEIADRTKSTPGSAGVLAGSSLLRGIQQQLVSTVSAAVPGASLADLGIQLTRQGAVTLDQAAFTAFAAREPEKAKSLTAAFATSLADIAKGASSPTGTVSQAITDGQSTSKDLGVRISDWTSRLERRRAALEAQFTALEVALDRSKSQSNYLAGALASLSPSS